MRKIMGLMLVLVMAALLASAAFAQETVIWNGTDISDAGITLGTWGSGTIAKETKDKKRLFEGPQSIKITSDGLYMGGRLDFSTPIPLAEGAIDPSKYIVLTLFFPDTETVGPNFASYDIVPYRIPKVRKLRVILSSDKGLNIPILCPTNPLDPDDNWVRVAVPIAKLIIPQGQTDFKLSRIVINSDTKATFWLGQIKLVTDNNPIKVDSLSSQVVAINDNLYFQTTARGGASPLNFAWDFGDGSVAPATPKSRIVNHTYTKGGDYNVSLTVSDALGIKAPVTVKTTVSVSE